MFVSSRLSAFPWSLPITPAEWTLVPRIQELANGLIRTKYSDGVWFQCGTKLNQNDWYITALRWAREIYKAEINFSIDGNRMLATILQESRADFCALGKTPRQMAFKYKYLKPHGRTFSYPKEQVLRFLNSKVWTRRKQEADLGLCQILYPKYSHGYIADQIMTLETGIKHCAMFAAYDITKGKGDPWQAWRGGKFCSQRNNTLKWWIRDIMKLCNGPYPCRLQRK